MRRAFPIVPPLLVLLLLVLPSVDAACTSTASGELYVATGTGNPPPFATPATNGINVQFVSSFLPGGYELFATGEMSSSCGILPECTYVPDFNVAWYKSAEPFDQLIRNDNHPGDQAAPIPATADYAVIYMRYGPDFGTSDGSAGAGYMFLTGC